MLKRVITACFTLLAITLVLFILMQLMPGSPFNDEKLSVEQRLSLYENYGLDQPVIVQFFRYLGKMLRGDFGVSYTISKNTPVMQLVQTRLPVSVRIGGAAVGLGAVLGLALGLVAALKKYDMGCCGNGDLGDWRLGAVLCVCAGVKLYAGF